MNSSTTTERILMHLQRTTTMFGNIVGIVTDRKACIKASVSPFSKCILAFSFN